MFDQPNFEEQAAWTIGPGFVQWKLAQIVKDYWPLFAGAIGLVGLIFHVKTKGKK